MNKKYIFRKSIFGLFDISVTMEKLLNLSLKCIWNKNIESNKNISKNMVTILHKRQTDEYIRSFFEYVQGP